VPDERPTAVSEREFQQQITDLLDMTGWAWFHVYPLQTRHGWRTPTTAKGIPDLVCVRPPYTLSVEVKSDKGAVGAEQLMWLERWSLIAGGRAWLLRPADDLQQIARWLQDPEHAPRRHGFTPRPDR
jgi:hypothetical protein